MILNGLFVCRDAIFCFSTKRLSKNISFILFQMTLFLWGAKKVITEPVEVTYLNYR